MNTEFDEIIIGLAEHFERQGIEFLIFGASARDLIAAKAGLALSRRKT